MSIEIVHVFSVESHKQKRSFIKDAHSNSDVHLFDDVAIFRDGGEAFCDVCQRSHEVPSSVDVLISGPSCKNFSKENQKRANFASCNLAGSSNVLFLK